MKGSFRFGAFLVLLGTAAAILEDQAGQLDWHKQNIGRVTHAEFAFRGRERVFVATASDVVASLDTRDGSIAWRQVLEEGDGIDALVLVPRPASVLTLSRRGRVLRAWHALDGTLLWEKSFASGGLQQQPKLLVLPDVTGDGSSDIVVLLGSKVQVLSAPSGKLVWSETLQGSVVSAALGSEEQGATLLAAISNLGSVHILTLDAKTGEQRGSQLLTSDADQVSLSASAAAAVTKDGKVCGLTLGAAAASCQQLSSVSADFGGSARLGPFLNPTVVPLLFAEGTVLLSVTNQVSVASKHPGLTAASAFEKQSVGLAGVSGEGKLRTQVWDLAAAAAAADSSWPSELLTAGGQPVQVASVLLGSRKVGEYSKPEATQHRWLVTAEDDSLYFLEAGKIVWRREEAAACIQSTLFVDLPPSTSESDAQLKGQGLTIGDRISAEILTIKSTFGIIQPDERAALKDLNRRLSTLLLPHRDANGFRKLVVAFSASGKLFGLHSGDGRILWHLTLEGLGANARLFPWRFPHDASRAPEVLVVGRQGGRASFAVVNAHSGKLLDGGVLSFLPEQVLEVPRTPADESAEQHAYLLVSEDLKISTLPASKESAELLEGAPLHFWRHDKTTGTVAGFRVAPGAAAAEQTWAIAFSGPSNTILDISARDPNDHVYSYAKVLGNRDLKLKYLNPNTIFVISGPPEGATPSGLQEATLTVQLIETVSGQILYRQSLEGAKGPVAAIVSENWAIYSYYSISNQRPEIAVLEFYDAQSRSLSIPSLLFGSQNSSLSSFAPTPIEVQHQSYFTGLGLKTLGVTKTRRGVTSKQLLLGTASNQIYLMDKRLIDPRRPKGTPTAEEKAEMLPPYSEELVFSPQLYASHKEVVEGLRGIVTSPANLESTTLMFAFGLDLFFTRVQPSKTFDLLPDDFPYAMLILVTAALTIGAFVLKRMDSAASLKKKWV